MQILQGLNQEQHQAVTYTDGPLLVLAGAGSGKTKVITNKICYLIEKLQLPSHKIFALTFTNKAAREMQARIKALNQHDAKVHISTFHALGLNILQQTAKQLNLKNNFSIYDSSDSQKLIQDITKVDDKNIAMQLTANISAIKNLGLTYDQFSLLPAHLQDPWLIDTFKAYNAALVNFNAIDLDDLIYLPYTLFKTNPEVLLTWQHKIHYMLIDEYQDTNTAQYNLIKLLTKPLGRFTAVGDDQQSIYSWRGAEPNNLKILNEDFPTLKIIKLEQNYRSTNYVLKCANALMANNQFLFHKNLWSNNFNGDMVAIIAAKNEEHEAELICSKLLEQKFLHQKKYSDFAILYRNNYQAKLFEKKFRELQIPYQISGSTSIFSNTEIKDLFGYLKLICNLNDDLSFLRIINTPSREIGPKTLEQLAIYAKNRNKSLFDACFEIGLSQYLTTKQINNLQQFANYILKLEQDLKHVDNITEFILEMLTDIQYEDWLYNHATNEASAKKKWTNILDCIHWIAKIITKDEGNLAKALHKILLIDMLNNQENNKAEEKVQLSTIHAAKGLEFNQVFIAAVNEGIIPHQNSIDSHEDNIAEERRLLYVAITRAKESLYISYCQHKKTFQEIVSLEPSRFLNDIKDHVNWPGQQPKDEKKRLDLGKAYFSKLQSLLES